MNSEKKSKKQPFSQDLISQEKSSAKYSYFLYFIPGFILLVSAIFYFFIAPSFGSKAGKIVGSKDGVTKGLSAGAEAGMNDGLSAQDTVAKISTKITGYGKEYGKLQVLLMDFCLTDFYTQGNNYAALFGLKGEGVYTVDLEQSKTSYDEADNKISIEIPKPVFEPYIDDSSIEILAEYEPKIFNGSTENGYNGYLNSRQETDKKIQEEFCSDDMIKQIEDLARNQVSSLAKSVCGNNVSIEVNFLASEE